MQNRKEIDPKFVRRLVTISLHRSNVRKKIKERSSVFCLINFNKKLLCVLDTRRENFYPLI